MLLLLSSWSLSLFIFNRFFFCFFFFFKQKTAYEMRISDWSSDVCSSDLTAELRDLLEYTRRFSIPLVAITARANSTLAEMAEVALLLPAVPEACPLGLAPTTSTTVSLAPGDALAVALLARKARKSGVSGTSVSRHVIPGGSRIHKKKKPAT